MRILLLGNWNHRLEEVVPAGEWIPLPAHAVDHAGRLQLAPLLESLPPGPSVIITDRDLTTPECSQIFGIADHRRQIAIVSTFSLDDGASALAPRLRNSIAHDWPTSKVCSTAGGLAAS